GCRHSTLLPLCWYIQCAIAARIKLLPAPVASSSTAGSIRWRIQLVAASTACCWYGLRLNAMTHYPPQSTALNPSPAAFQQQPWRTIRSLFALLSLASCRIFLRLSRQRLLPVHLGFLSARPWRCLVCAYARHTWPAAPHNAYH